MNEPVSVIIPAYNEELSVGAVIDRIRKVFHERRISHEVLVVDDGSTDRTAEIAIKSGAVVVEHPQNAGYGRSLKSGIQQASHDLLAITDADGTYPVERLPELLERAEKFDMVVGQRTGRNYVGSIPKRIGRIVFRLLSEFATGRRIPDINSGLRVFRRRQVMPFFPYISSGFSFTTTVTLVYMLNGLFVDYVPIDYRRRSGRTKIRHFRDALRALQIVVEAILRCNPIKVFLLLAAPFWLAAILFLCVGLSISCWILTIAGFVMLHTGTIVLAIGFLAVAALPEPRMIRRGIGAAERHEEDGPTTPVGEA